MPSCVSVRPATNHKLFFFKEMNTDSQNWTIIDLDKWAAAKILLLKFSIKMDKMEPQERDPRE